MRKLGLRPRNSFSGNKYSFVLTKNMSDSSKHFWPISFSSWQTKWRYLVWRIGPKSDSWQPFRSIKLTTSLQRTIYLWMVHARPCRCRDSRPIEPLSGSSIVQPAAAAARLGSQESCDLIYKVTGLGILTNHAIPYSRTSRLFRMLLQLSSCYVRMRESRSLQSARLSLQSS
jgi:hypothetical protein